MDSFKEDVSRKKTQSIVIEMKLGKNLVSIRPAENICRRVSFGSKKQ